MSVVYDLLSSRYRKILAVIIPLVTSMTLYYLSFLAFRYVTVIKLANRVTSSLQIPVYMVNLLVVIGLFTAATQFLRICYLNVTNKGEKDLIGTYPQGE
jgi:TRAP-type C4-dicarboxylate transport system permease small subunit